MATSRASDDKTMKSSLGWLEKLTPLFLKNCASVNVIPHLYHGSQTLQKLMGRTLDFNQTYRDTLQHKTFDEGFNDNNLPFFDFPSILWLLYYVENQSVHVKFLVQGVINRFNEGHFNDEVHHEKEDNLQTPTAKTDLKNFAIQQQQQPQTNHMKKYDKEQLVDLLCTFFGPDDELVVHDFLLANLWTHAEGNIRDFLDSYTHLHELKTKRERATTLFNVEKDRVQLNLKQMTVTLYTCQTKADLQYKEIEWEQAMHNAKMEVEQKRLEREVRRYEIENGITTTPTPTPQPQQEEKSQDKSHTKSRPTKTKTKTKTTMTVAGTVIRKLLKQKFGPKLVTRCGKDGCKNFVSAMRCYVVAQPGYTHGSLELVQIVCACHALFTPEHFVSITEHSVNLKMAETWLYRFGMLTSIGTCGICADDHEQVHIWDNVENCHVVAEAAGGTIDPDNLVIGHALCNRKQGERFLPDYQRSTFVVEAKIENSSDGQVPKELLELARKCLTTLSRKKQHLDPIAEINKRIQEALGAKKRISNMISEEETTPVTPPNTPCQFSSDNNEEIHRSKYFE